MGLPAEIILCLNPIFQELNQLDEGINLTEFIDATMRLYNVSKFFFKHADTWPRRKKPFDNV